MSSTEPLIEIAGVWLPNKGAELMAHTVVTQLGSRLPGARFCSRAQGPDAHRRSMGIEPITARRSHQIAARLFRAFYGGAKDNGQLPGVTHVIDISGYAYGDHWGVQKARNRAGAYLRAGLPLYMLPQAFGPFEDTKLSNEMLRIVTDARRISARDAESLAHLEALGVGRALPRFPDITFSLDVSDRPVAMPEQPFSALVLNRKSIGAGIDEAGLLSLYAEAAKILKANRLPPIIVLHEPQADRIISEQLAEIAGLEIVCLDDARDIKALVGSAELVVTGRFHGLVNGLSAAVPSFAVSWSHKYQELLGEFGCPDHVLSDDAPAFLARVEALAADPAARTALSSRLVAVAHDNKQRLAELWDDLAADIAATS